MTSRIFLRFLVSLFHNPLMTSSNDLIQTLLKILETKKQTNPAYSLRAMARDIGIPQPILSLYLRKKRALSPYLAYKIGLYFKLDELKIYHLIVTTFDKNKRN